MWQNAQTVFLSILLESLPFVLAGVLVSSVIQSMVSQETFLRMIPKRKTLAVVYASLLGLVLPVCDCGAVPVARSLMQKGVPVSAAMAFVLAAPAINPLTMVATYVAFGGSTVMMGLRTVAALSIAVLVGWLFLWLRIEKVKPFPLAPVALSATVPTSGTRFFLIAGVLGHALRELFEVGVFIVAGAAVAAAIQVWFPASILSAVGQHPIGSVGGMMGLGILFSLCAQADAFVARSLAGVSTVGGVFGFLVIGQMIDIRNFLLLPRAFHRKVVILTFFVTFVLTLLLGVMVNYTDLSTT
ncbi:permease [Aneurinibacillus danicus]|uniref:Uncharacterized protein n=1 Tax=Aneurinibacillus danicus TaxID=267746 RepID=A0A511VD11_9BACL|nr:permease [Aneurinibacillus danicus]GEN36786.1 hypothetical protein ADA01nite_42460 [Aneurinibacillus danicus]